jgi:hypothetical protein
MLLQAVNYTLVSSGMNGLYELHVVTLYILLGNTYIIET